jgi:hypothetical protein
MRPGRLTNWRRKPIGYAPQPQNRESQSESLRRSFTVAWQQALEPSERLQRVTMWIYLVAIIFVGIFGESKTLEYILLFVAFSLTMLLRRLWLWRNGDKRRRP